jgi:hypothetical protein
MSRSHGARTMLPKLCLALALVFVLGLTPTLATPVEADFGSPGGIAALPSSVPAVPGISGQSIPAIVGSGEPAIVAVFCNDGTGALPDAASPCANPITFELARLYPDSGAPLATFAATGTDSLVVTDNATADMDAATGVVAVEVDAGWGVNEVVRATGTDEAGDSRSVDIVVVDTILAWGSTGAVTRDGPVFISYRCDVTGRVPLTPDTPPWEIDPDADASQGLDDMYDGYYTAVYDDIGPGLGYGSNTMVGDVDFIDTWCGGNTGGSLFDDFVDFQTDLGSFSVTSLATDLEAQSFSLWSTIGYFYPPVLDSDCGEGKNVDVFDIDSLYTWAEFLFLGAFQGGCDIGGWRDGVVTTEIWPSGDVGVATITAQQGGGAGPPRTITVTFVGPPSLLAFISGPEVTNQNRNPFTVVVVDQGGRPVADEVVECETAPPSAPFIVVPSTATTGPYSGLAGEATFDPGLVAVTSHIIGGEEFDLTCVVESDPSVFATVTVTVPLSWGAVGGIAELPAFPGTFTEQAGASSGSPGWSAGSYVALASALAATALSTVIGAWYTRRRGLR